VLCPDLRGVQSALVILNVLVLAGLKTCTILSFVFISDEQDEKIQILFNLSLINKPRLCIIISLGYLMKGVGYYFRLQEL
jgi:hypothetical protein